MKRPSTSEVEDRIRRLLLVLAVQYPSLARAQATSPPAAPLPEEESTPSAPPTSTGPVVEQSATTAEQPAPPEKISPVNVTAAVPARGLGLHSDAALVSGGLFSSKEFWETGVGMGTVRDTFVGYRVSLGTRLDLASGVTLRGAASLDAFSLTTRVREYRSGLDAYVWEGKTRFLFMYGLEAEVDGPPMTHQIAVGGRLAAVRCDCSSGIPGPLMTAGARVRAPNLFGGIDVARIDHNNGTTYGFLLTAGVTDRPGKIAALSSLGLVGTGLVVAIIVLMVEPPPD